MKNIVSTDESVKRQITDSNSEHLTDSDLESIHEYLNEYYYKNNQANKIRVLVLVMEG